MNYDHWITHVDSPFNRSYWHVPPRHPSSPPQIEFLYEETTISKFIFVTEEEIHPNDPKSVLWFEKGFMEFETRETEKYDVWGESWL